MKTNLKLNHALALTLVGASWPTLAVAQNDDSEGVLDEEQLVILEEAQAAGDVPIEESILPTTRPFISLYGTEKDVMNTPRNVTIVSREQLDNISIRDPRDFSKVTSSAYTASNFGAPANPSIRGQISDVLVNGMRRGLTTNGNGMPTNFNAVESVNILKGPPSVSIGASQYVGGYVDLATKMPKFSGNEGTFSMTLDSEGLRVYQLDANYRASDELAFRGSYTLEDTDGYYYKPDFERKTHAIYGALSWKPSSSYRLDLNAEVFLADYTENWGLNRVTQDLIDNGTYQTGVVSVPQADALTDPATYLFGAGGGPGVIPEGEEIRIDRKRRLLNPDDDSEGKMVTAQAIQTFSPDNGPTIKNNTLIVYRDRSTYSSYQYAETMRDNYAIDNRLETRLSAQTGDVLHDINTGISGRFTSVVAANDFFHEPAQFWDLSRPLDEIGVTDEFVFFDNPFTAFTSASVPLIGETARGDLTLGRPATPGGNYGTFEFDPAKLPDTLAFNPGNLNEDGNPTATYASNGDSNDSEVWTVGAFVQDDIKISDRLSVLLGGRVDYIDVETKDPVFDDTVVFLQRFGQDGEAERLMAMGADEASLDDVLYNANASVTFKPTRSTTTYITYNYAESQPTDNGGGISVDTALAEEEFVQETQLWEAGFKASLLENTLFYNVALFDQKRTQPVQDGNIDTEAMGVETELNFQPSRQFYATFGYSFIDAEAKGLPGSFIAEAVPFNGTFNNVGLAVGDAELPSVPDHLFNTLLSYKPAERWALTASAIVTSRIPLTFGGAGNVFGGTIETAEIPWQHSIDLGVRYEGEGWSVSAKAINVTDERNFGAVNSIYGNASLFVEKDRHFELTLNYDF